MWYALIFALFLLSLITILQTPKEWWTKKVPLILLVVFHGIGITSLILLLFVFHQNDDTTFRRIVLAVETFYFIFILFSSVLAIFRTCLFYAARNFKKYKFSEIVSNQKIFFAVSLVLTITYLIPAIICAVSLPKTEYAIDVDKPNTVPSTKIALIADLHVGAGATSEQLDYMQDMLNDMKVDTVLIAGDVADSSSSPADLENLQNKLANIKSTYGTYYAEGNHEIESRTDPIPYLQKAGVYILQDDAVTLPNNVNILGFKDNSNKTIPEIFQSKNIDASHPCIAIKHRPKDLAELAQDCDIVVTGHTHGYQYPFMNIISPFRRDLSYGRKQFDNLTAITTSGVAEWGYHAKWPSSSEIVQLNINFKKESAR